MKNEKEHIHYTMDIDMASALVVSGAELIERRVNMQERKMVFGLRHEKIDELVSQYMNDELKISIRKFKNTLYDLKRLSLDSININ